VTPVTPHDDGPPRRPDPAAGVFDTLLVQRGRPVALDEHLARLTRSVHEVYAVAHDAGDLAERVHRAAAAGPPLQRVRVTFVPGSGASVDAEPLAARPRGPWRLVVRRLPGGWGAHKWCDRAQLQEWADAADPALDPMLVDEDDLLLETGRGNVFVVRGDAVATPPLDGRILPGVTRGAVLRLLGDLGVAVHERPVALADLATATEVFVTSAIGGVRPVEACAPVGEWPVGPVTRAVDDALECAWAAP
jgi:para-aminobenzoate synthetase/4-amino-4-deoxychorismate lyase